jgi:signal transduction histidine kinase
MRFTIVDRRGLIATLVALGVMVLTFVAAFTWLQYRMVDLHSRQILQSMRQELLLRQQYERSVGRQALVAGIDLRNRVVSDGRYFALFTSDRQPVVGSLSAIPGGARVFESRFAPYTVDSDNGIKYYVASMRNEDGSIFVMVQGDKDQREIALSLGRAAAVNTFMLILIGVIAAYVLNRYLLDHVRGLSMTARQIMRGQMAARAPARRRLDAMGALTTTFNEMLDQNESLVTGMRTVTESLAHDLRSPLMRVSRSIAAARQTDSDVVREQLLNDAETDATRALQTFNSLIDLARAEAGLSRDSMEKLDLGSLATDVAELFEPLAEERGQRLERHISPIGIFGHPQASARELDRKRDQVFACWIHAASDGQAVTRERRGGDRRRRQRTRDPQKCARTGGSTLRETRESRSSAGCRARACHRGGCRAFAPRQAHSRKRRPRIAGAFTVWLLVTRALRKRPLQA